MNAVVVVVGCVVNCSGCDIVSLDRDVNVVVVVVVVVVMVVVVAICR